MAKEPLKFETEKDFQDYKKEIDEAREEVAAGIKEAHLNIKDGEKINVNIDFKGLAKALYDLQKTLKEGWEEFRIELINNKQEFDFLASAPQKVVNLEPFIDFTSAGLSIADFYHECYTDDWQPKKGSPYYVYITQARKRRAEYNKREKENKKFNSLQLFSEGADNSPIAKTPYHFMMHNKLIDVMRFGEVIAPPDKAQHFDMRVINATKTKPAVLADTIIIYRGDQNIIGANLNAYQNEISDSLCSIWHLAAVKGEPTAAFTIDSLYGNMTKGNSKPSKRQAEEIRRNIEEFRALFPKINITEEIKRYGVNDGKEHIIRGAWLQYYEVIEKSKNGKEVTKYVMTEPPLNYSYCMLTKQYSVIPAKDAIINDVDENGNILQSVVSMTPKRIAIRGYLLERLEIMKNDEAKAKKSKLEYDRQNKKKPDYIEKPIAEYRRHSRKIDLETIFANADISTGTRADTKRNRDFVIQVLDDRKAKGKIKNYRTVCEHKKVTGFVIEI